MALRTVWKGRVGRALTVSVPVVCVVLLATATVVRNVVWSDALSLWQDTVRKSPHKVRPYNNLATAHLRLRQFEAAIDASKQALSIDPGSGIARYNLLEAYLYRGSWEVLMAALRDALRENPAHAVIWVSKRGRRLRRPRPIRTGPWDCFTWRSCGIGSRRSSISGQNSGFACGGFVAGPSGVSLAS